MRDGWTSGIERKVEVGEVGVTSGEWLSGEETVAVPVSLRLVFLVRTRVCPPKIASSSSASLSG